MIIRWCLIAEFNLSRLRLEMEREKKLAKISLIVKSFIHATPLSYAFYLDQSLPLVHATLKPLHSVERALSSVQKTQSSRN